MGALVSNLELLVMNVLLLAVLFCFNLRYWKPKIINPLSSMYLLTIVGSIAEGFAFYADGKPDLNWLNYLSNILYLGSIALMGVCLLLYSSRQFPKPIWKNRRQQLLLLLPTFFELIVLVTAPLTGLIFTVSPEGFYSRGGTFWIQMLPYANLLLTTAYGVYWFVNTETIKERNLYLAISLFTLPPFLLGGLQLLVPANSLDTMEFSFTLSLICNYAVSQNSRITRDTLTRLPNREVLDVVLTEKMNNGRKGLTDSLFVLMGDLDGFKSINDTYGHLEGDRALILAADELYAISRAYKGTAARFGGDEFVLVIEAMTEETPKHVIEEINQRLTAVCKNEKFNLHMSVGYARYRASDTIADLLRAADRELYRVKHEHRAGR